MPAAEGAAPGFWAPSPDAVVRAQITAFARESHQSWGAPTEALANYQDLWHWSIGDVANFWRAVADFFSVPGVAAASVGLTPATMPGAQWFPDVDINYAERVLSAGSGDRVALIEVTEAPDAESAFTQRAVSWADLHSQVGAAAAGLRELGVGPGDRVVGYLSNSPETIVAFLATASLGAVWACCGVEYAPAAAVSRFAQLDPVVLVAADGHRFGGRERDRREAVAAVAAELPTLKAIIGVPRLGRPIDGAVRWADLLSRPDRVLPVRTGFNDPLWVLFSSGTTGMPKGIVHGHGGVVLEHLKSLGLHTDVTAADRMFWYTTPSWMVWNVQVSALLLGATTICYEGSPTFPTADTLWRISAECSATVLGTSPGYLTASAKQALQPGRKHDLSALRSIGTSGSVLPADANAWVAAHVGADVYLSSTSGGTDVVGGFAGGVPTLPVRPGELTAPMLGVALAAWTEDGKSVVDQVGELVVTQPMPSMPLRLWNDPDGNRYREAYFATYPGVWRHGDWITMLADGGVVVHGRSDATLNRNGVRMGSADIYSAVERLPEIADSLVVGVELPDGRYWMPMFVVPATGVIVDEQVREAIKQAIRRDASPRHVPDDIIVAPGIPHTRTGKKLEVPIKRLIQGVAVDNVVDPGSVDDPDLLTWYAAIRPPAIESVDR